MRQVSARATRLLCPRSRTRYVKAENKLAKMAASNKMTSIFTTERDV